MLASTKDELGNTTSFTYSTDFAGAYLTQTNLPDTQMPDTGAPLVHHQTSASYDYNTGLMTSATDENGNPFTYQYDTARLLLTQANHPDQGSTKYFYPIRRQLSASDRLIARTTTIISCISTGSVARFKRSKLRRRVLYWLIQPTTQRVM